MGWRRSTKGEVVSPKATQSRDLPNTDASSQHAINHGERKNGAPPRDVICHICGRKYTIHSIHIHVPQCEKLFVAQQAKFPVKDRKPTPKLPRDIAKMSLHQRNKVAKGLYENFVMEKCLYCGRTFMEGRLIKHIHSCARSHGKTHRNNGISSSHKELRWATYAFNTKDCVTTAKTEAKNTAICYVCGLKYTTHSIDIHVPQCKKLFLARQEKLSKYERKPLPTAPPKTMTLAERNAFATKQYNNHVLEACTYCNRTFFSDRLSVHIKSCERNHLKKNKHQPTCMK